MAMATSREDRAAWARQVESLRRLENPQGAEVTGDQRRRLVAFMNRVRAARGTAPLVNDEDTYPEIGFHRRAVARGLTS
jgi:hypothetical protein